ncbi:MAG: 4'-phosphopantetheinyl transferase superfamily protein [Kordiimonadaceae bacterium]|nr:4'-phosphopantetheinyl transferase superfamily protein [Kordiimonadaceae bacterium]
MQILENIPHRVEGWWLDIDTISQAQWPQLEMLLEQAERDRAQRFHFVHDKKSYIAAHAITRSLLSTWIDGCPTDWRFSISALGKPEVILPKCVPRLRINLAHTRGMVVVALTVDHDIGVDIEWLGRKSSFLDLAKTVFTSEEQALLAAAPPEEKKALFLTLWTLKEAYIKAIGKGLSLPLDSFHYSLDPLAIHFKSTRPDIALDDPKLWHLDHFYPGADHIAALAVHHPKPENISVSFKAAPLQAMLVQPP